MPPLEANNFLATISDQRRQLLRTRGLLLLRVPVLDDGIDATFRWHQEPQPDGHRLSNAIWYFDGSMLNGKWVDLRTTGFAIAVISASGDLLGFGAGAPPPWCTTAAAAEAWALQEVLRQCPDPPQMRTDCQSLLSTIQGGLADAADASRPLARIWLTIAHLLDGDFAALHSSGRLVWMPAHTSLASVAEVKLSNGQRLSCIDWRANRSVDALAKGAAFRGPAPAARVQVLGAAEKAVRHAAMLLGRVTHAANNVRTVSMGPDGKPIVHIRRDASQAEQRGWG